MSALTLKTYESGRHLLDYGQWIDMTAFRSTVNATKCDEAERGDLFLARYSRRLFPSAARQFILRAK